MDIKTFTPGILQYIPFFYVIWSDDLLSYSETSIVKKAVNDDQSLTQADQKQLLQWLDRKKPPSNKTIKNWKHTIDHSETKLLESEVYPLSSFSQKIVCYYHQECPFNDYLKEIEINLGIQPNHYNYLFDIEVVGDQLRNTYEAPTLDGIIKGKHVAAIDSFRKLVQDFIFDYSVRPTKEDKREHVLKQVQMLAVEGYGAMAYPQEYGGQDDMCGYAKVFENMMFVDGSLTIKSGVQFGLFGGSIQKLGTKRHFDTYLKDAGDAELLGCFAMTETGHGSNVRGIKTTATYDKESDSIIIHTPGKLDNKEYIGNALDSKMASVFAQLIVNGKNEGVHAVLVPIRDENHQLLPGIKVEDNGYKIGLNGVDNGKIWFHQVRVPRENLLNKYGDINTDGVYTSLIKNPNKRFFTMLGTLVGGRICVARAGLGGAKKALTITIKHALKRRQFNDSIKIQEDLLIDYPSYQLRVIPSISMAYVYDVTLSKMMELYNDQNKDSRKVETMVAGLKSLITWFANQTIQECREACGGKGYLLENQIGDLKGDVDIFTTFEGDNTVLLQLAAKGVLSDFKDELSNDGVFSVLKLLGSRLNDKLTTINPVYVNKTDADHLYDPQFHAHAFNYRTRRLTYTVAMRIRNYIKKGMSSYQAFLKVQSHIQALGNAYSIELANNTFVAFTSTIEDTKYQSLFKKLGALYALYHIKKDASWFLEQGYISGTKSKAIRQRTERLCSELRPHVETLVDGFGIPASCISAPIAN